MKDLLELMKTRRSVRKYKPDMIPQDVLRYHVRTFSTAS